jgi:hypothetical protein
MNGQELLALAPQLAAHGLGSDPEPDHSLDRLLPTLPLFFCSNEHRAQLLEGILALSTKKTARAKSRIANDVLATHRSDEIQALTDFRSFRY